ncbi:hypothetical protein [Azorhizobium caulinodans]|uniref:hypothetical protein n=1 Tax=Azorhizobium caulinodans TaxID=7 RepID=UPI002FBF13F6
MANSLELYDPAQVPVSTFNTATDLPLARRGDGFVYADMRGDWSVQQQDVAGDVTLDMSQQRAFRLRLQGDGQLAFAGAPGGALLISLVIQLVQGVGAPHQVSWPAGVAWSGGYAPSLVAVSGGTDIFQLLSFDGGATWCAGRLMQTGA